MSSILIVDDNERNRYLMRAMLAGHGYEVMEASNGAEALAAAREQPPDLIAVSYTHLTLPTIYSV